MATLTSMLPPQRVAYELFCKSTVLRGFGTHALADVGEQSLLSRFDTKYLLPPQHLEEFLQMLRSAYTLLDVAGSTVHGYRTLYFDTPTFDLYFAHHNNRVPRGKVRCRTYVDTGRCYLELKTKDNRGRTDKRRLACTGVVRQEDIATLLHQAPFAVAPDPAQLQGRVTVEYQRIALWNRGLGERVSIDLDLRAGRHDVHAGYGFGALAVVEVKQAALNRRSPALAALRQFGLRPQAFSKYCVACALLYPQQLRSNRFRGLLRQLNPFLATHPQQELLHAGF